MGKRYNFSVKTLKHRDTIGPNMKKEFLGEQRKDRLLTVANNAMAETSSINTFSESMGRELTVEEDRSFFCSELIAKAYKVCRIMEDNT